MLTLALLAAAVLLVPACSPGARSYKNDNRRLLASLPVYPGAREVEREDSVRTEGDRNAGWHLRAVYELPPGATVEQVLGFYRDRMTGWTPEPDCCGGLDAASFRRGSEQVTVNADNVVQVRTYEVGVDARAP